MSPWPPLWVRLLRRTDESDEEYVSLPILDAGLANSGIDRSIKSERDPNISEELQESESATDAPDSVTFSIELSSNASEDAEENDTAPSSKETPETSEPTATETTSSESTPDETPEVRKKFRSNDPIHWYGILVPQSLRKAQSTFTAVVDNQVPDLASTALEMRALEQRISKLQAQLESED